MSTTVPYPWLGWCPACSTEVHYDRWSELAVCWGCGARLRPEHDCGEDGCDDWLTLAVTPPAPALCCASHHGPPARCEACDYLPPVRYWHGGRAWLCASCDWPTNALMGGEALLWRAMLTQALRRAQKVRGTV